MAVTSAFSKDFLQRQLDERIGFRSCWKQQRLPTNPTKTKDPIIKHGETCWWASVHPKGRKRCLVWSRRHQKLKNRETCEGPTSIQSCVPVSDELVDKDENALKQNGETSEWTIVRSARGNRHWLQSARICHMQLWKKQKISAVKSSWLIETYFKQTYSRITSTTHSATIRRRWSANFAM